MDPPKILGAADLFAVIDRAFRRRARCPECTFSLPYPSHAPRSNWAVLIDHRCCEMCRHALERLIARLQGEYRLG